MKLDEEWDPTKMDHNITDNNQWINLHNQEIEDMAGSLDNNIERLVNWHKINNHLIKDAIEGSKKCVLKIL